MTLRQTVEDYVEFEQRNKHIAARKYLPIDTESHLSRCLSSWSQITYREANSMEITCKHAMIHVLIKVFSSKEYKQGK